MRFAIYIGVICYFIITTMVRDDSSFEYVIARMLFLIMIGIALILSGIERLLREVRLLNTSTKHRGAAPKHQDLTK